MAKRQTRKSISLRGTTYAKVREHCARAGVSMSDFLEERIAEWFAGRATAPTKDGAAITPAPAARRCPKCSGSIGLVCPRNWPSTGVIVYVSDLPADATGVVYDARCPCGWHGSLPALPSRAALAAPKRPSSATTPTGRPRCAALVGSRAALQCMNAARAGDSLCGIHRNQVARGPAAPGIEVPAALPAIPAVSLPPIPTVALPAIPEAAAPTVTGKRLAPVVPPAARPGEHPAREGSDDPARSGRGAEARVKVALAKVAPRFAGDYKAIRF